MLLPGTRISAEGIANITHGTRISRITQIQERRPFHDLDYPLPARWDWAIRKIGVPEIIRVLGGPSAESTHTPR